jgi:hypothetical protein
MVDKSSDVKSKHADFFGIGSNPKPKLHSIEEVKDWKNIRPKQDYDAVNR